MHGSRLQGIQQAAFKEIVSFLFALAVEGIVTIGKPIQEGIGPVGWVVFGQRLNTLVVSDTNQFDPLLGHLTLAPHPKPRAPAGH